MTETTSGRQSPSLQPFTIKDVQQQSSLERALFIYHGKVYDLTDFVDSHPGGDILLDYCGQDIEAIMSDERFHTHSKSAYMLMDDYCIGIITNTNTVLCEDADCESKTFQFLNYSEKKSQLNSLGSSASFSSITNYTESDPDGLSDPMDSGSKVSDGLSGSNEIEKPTIEEFLVSTDIHAKMEYERNRAAKSKFIDTAQPLFWQLWTLKNLDKETYLREVHKPRHLKYVARFFEHPFLEFFSRTPWYIIPLIWIPVSLALIHMALQTLPLLAVTVIFALGVGFWSVLEYVLHRFLFHLDERLPNNKVAFMLHFLFHGVHHFLPMDRLRLVFPPVLATIIISGLWTVYTIFLPVDVTCVFIAGSLIGYVAYDMTHYYLHHGIPYFTHFKRMKSYHLDHHYKDYHEGYGITSTFWDYRFGTQIHEESRRR